MLKTLPTLLFAFACFIVNAQFPSIMWEYETFAPAFGSSAAADIDHDGYYEIVFSTYTNDGRIHCLNAEDGSPEWTFDLGGCGDVAPIIHDVNLDDTLDVIVNGSCNPEIFCINGITGKLIWKKSSGGGDSPPTIADVDMDGKPEILFGSFGGQIRIYNGEDGSTYRIIQADETGGALQTAPTLVDVDKDGDLDILAANYFNTNGLFYWAINIQDGEKIWTHEEQNPDASFNAYHGGAVADVDEDGELEYVVGSNAGFVLALNVEDGSTLWKKDIPGSNMQALTITDIDQDGELEIICNNADSETFDSRIRILNGADGSQEWSYPIQFSSFRGMSVSDIDGNGQLDLVSGHFLGTLRVLEAYSDVIWEMDLSDFFNTGAPYITVDHQPLIADFDQNGTLDIFTVAGYGTYTPDAQNTGKAFMIEAGPGMCPEWLMFRYDKLRSGFMPTDTLAQCQSTSTLENESFESSVQIFPNPGKDWLHISFHVNERSEISISLYNLNGYQEILLLEEEFSSGDHQLELSIPTDQSSGLHMFNMIKNKVLIHSELVFLD